MQRVAQHVDEAEGGETLAEHDDEQHGEDGERGLDDDVPVKEHAHADEEEHGEGVLERERFGGRPVGEFRLAHHHACEEGAEGEAHVEDGGGAVGDANGCGKHEEREELAGARAGNLSHDPREDAAADEHHHGDEGDDVADRDGDLDRNVLTRNAWRGVGAEKAGERRQKHEDKHGGDVLDDEPADGDLAVHALQDSSHFKRLEKHDRRCTREAHAEHECIPPVPVPDEVRDEAAEQGGDEHLQHGPGHGDALDVHQVSNGEVEADAEHQQHDADFGELLGKGCVGEDARRVLARSNACQKVADERRCLEEALGQKAEDERQTEGDDEC